MYDLTIALCFSPGCVKPDDLYRLAWADDPRVSPDGHTVAFVAIGLDEEKNDYTASIWLVPVDGSEAPRRLTAGPKQDLAPRWSPDGTRLAFVSNRGEKIKAKQLYVIPVAGGEPSRLTELDEDVGEVAWSPDGQRLAFSARVRDPEYEEEDEKRRRPRQVLAPAVQVRQRGLDGRPAAAPVRRRRPTARSRRASSRKATSKTEALPGRRTEAGSRSRRPARQDWDIERVHHVYLVDPNGGEPEQLTEGRALVRGALLVAGRLADRLPVQSRRVRLPASRPDRRGRRGHRGAPPADRPRSTSTARPTRPVREPVWAGDVAPVRGRGRGQQRLRTAFLPTARPAPSRCSTETCGSPASTGPAARRSHTATTPTSPPEVFSGEKQLRDVELGLQVVGRALGAGALHGGLGRRVRGRGVADAACRLRGRTSGTPSCSASTAAPSRSTATGSSTSSRSTRVPATRCSTRTRAARRATRRSGAGRSTGRSRAGPAGEPVDYEDVTAVVDAALERFDFCDPDRLGVLGGSYGGYMTSWIVSHTDRFRAACSERSVNNFVLEGGSSDIGWVLQGDRRRVLVRGAGRLPEALAVALRGEHHDAAPHPPFRERPALPGRPRGGPVRDPPAAEARGRARPLPGRVARAHAVRVAAAPRDALRSDPRLVRALPGAGHAGTAGRLTPIIESRVTSAASSSSPSPSVASGRRGTTR